DDQLAMNNGQTVGRNYQSTVRLARELDDPTLDLRRVLQTYRADLRHSDSASQGLDHAELGGSGRVSLIAKNRDAPHVRRNLLQQIEPFPADIEFEVGKASGIPPWSSKVFNETPPDCVGSLNEDDRQRAGHLL